MFFLLGFCFYFVEDVRLGFVRIQLTSQSGHIRMLFVFVIEIPCHLME